MINHNHNEITCNMTRGGAHMKQVMDEAWSNAKSLKMTMMPSLTFAKNVNEQEQLGELTLNFICKIIMKGVAKQP